jgi:hypothetical protein
MSKPNYEMIAVINSKAHYIAGDSEKDCLERVEASYPGTKINVLDPTKNNYLMAAEIIKDGEASTPVWVSIFQGTSRIEAKKHKKTYIREFGRGAKFVELDTAQRNYAFRSATIGHNMNVVKVPRRTEVN